MASGWPGRILAWLLAAVVLTAASPGARSGGVTPAALAGAGTLTVIVENLRSSAGELHVAIWDEPDGFADGNRSLADTAVPATEGEQRIVFQDLAPGRYAIAAYHDENGNGEFDRSLIGFPAEGLGFSNGAWLSVLGAPSFEEAAIELNGSAADAIVTLRY